MPGPSHFAGAGRAPARAAVDCPITTSGAAPLIVDGFGRVGRSTFTGGAIMEGAQSNRHSRARVAETAKDASRHATSMQRRTRRSTSTIGGAAPDTIIGRAAADRAGARPYRATRCEKRDEMCHAGSRGSASLSVATASANQIGKPSIPSHRYSLRGKRSEHYR